MYYQIRVYTLRITHTCTYCCVSKLSKFGAYLLTIIQSCTLTMHFCLWEIPCNYFPLYFSKESVYIRGVPNVCLSKHRCQKRSDWMFRINHPITVNITNKCGLVKNWNESEFGNTLFGTNLRIHELVIFNQITKIDTHEEKYFHSIRN